MVNETRLGRVVEQDAEASLLIADVPVADAQCDGRRRCTWGLEAHLRM